MKKIKIVQSGWETYTGSLGQVEFENGVSTRAVTEREVDFLAAVVSVETLEGESVGIAQRMIGGVTIPAVIADALVAQSEGEKKAETAKLVPAGPQVSKVVLRRWSGEELEEIADEKGLAGLREIATPRGVKGRSIVELIRDILAEQEARDPKVEDAPVPEGDAEVEVPGPDHGGVLFQEKDPIVNPPAIDPVAAAMAAAGTPAPDAPAPEADATNSDTATEA